MTETRLNMIIIKIKIIPIDPYVEGHWYSVTPLPLRVLFRQLSDRQDERFVDQHNFGRPHHADLILTKVD